MKIRTDFVTNSSSACYVVQLQFKNYRDASHEVKIVTSDSGTEFEGSEPFGKRVKSQWHAKSLDIRRVKDGPDGRVLIGGVTFSECPDLESVIRHMLSMVMADLYDDGGYLSGNQLVPGVAKAISDRCAEKGITKENLRIIGMKIHAMPWGDSCYEIDEFIEQWGMSVREDAAIYTRRKAWRGPNTPNWHPEWRDTVWWPYTGTPDPTPYDLVACDAVDRNEVRHIDFAGLDTQKMTSMDYLLAGCEGLLELDLSGFCTSEVASMSCMFYGCQSLKALDLSVFDTSKVTDMSGMFSGCSGLTELDLSTLDASQVTDTDLMFEGCTGLRRWLIGESWPVHLEGAIPQPTAPNGTWWSERAGAWMSVDEIRERGPMADTFTSSAPIA